MRGRISFLKWSYEFVECDGASYFIHRINCPNGILLPVGMEIEFDVGTNPLNGRPQAINIRLVESNQPSTPDNFLVASPEATIGESHDCK